MGIQFVDVPGQQRRPQRPRVDRRTLTFDYDHIPEGDEFEQEKHRMGISITSYMEFRNLEYAGGHNSEVMVIPNPDGPIGARIRVSFNVRPKPQ